MNYDNRLEKVAVIGAGGKMGRGISLLLAIEMTKLQLRPENKNKSFELVLMARSNHSISDLLRFVDSQAVKYAEKKIVLLRKLYAADEDLIENGDIIRRFLQDLSSIIRPVTNLESVYGSALFFETIVENVEDKIELFSKINQNCKGDFWVFTNTSSIPIKELEQKAGLDGNIVGFHLYNPPIIQRLVEVIRTQHTGQELVDFAELLAKNWDKTVVFSKDFAGFIGNGFFMREVDFAVQEVNRLSKDFSFVQAVYIVNKATQDFLIRPMGIFQLIDYVGIDICQRIMKIINERSDDGILDFDFLNDYVSSGVSGGQYSDGSQKDGLFKYEKGKIAAIFDPGKRAYVALSEVGAFCDTMIGSLPVGGVSWKELSSKPTKEEILREHFSELRGSNSLGCAIARNFGKHAGDTGLKLVDFGIADDAENVNLVIKTGFFHLYGPINDFF